MLEIYKLRRDFPPNTESRGRMITCGFKCDQCSCLIRDGFELLQPIIRIFNWAKEGAITSVTKSDDPQHFCHACTKAMFFPVVVEPQRRQF